MKILSQRRWSGIWCDCKYGMILYCGLIPTEGGESERALWSLETSPTWSWHPGCGTIWMENVYSSYFSYLHNQKPDGTGGCIPAQGFKGFSSHRSGGCEGREAPNLAGKGVEKKRMLALTGFLLSSSIFCLGSQLMGRTLLSTSRWVFTLS